MRRSRPLISSGTRAVSVAAMCERWTVHLFAKAFNLRHDPDQLRALASALSRAGSFLGRSGARSRRPSPCRGTRLSRKRLARCRGTLFPFQGAFGRARSRPRRFFTSGASALACFRVRADAFPRFGGGSFTPARRAFDKPMAIACSGERAPCSPSLMCSISSRTNSPAWVEGALPSRSSSRARSIGSSSGIQSSFAGKCLIGCNENQLGRWRSTEESSGPC